MEYYRERRKEKSREILSQISSSGQENPSMDNWETEHFKNSAALFLSEPSLLVQLCLSEGISSEKLRQRLLRQISGFRN